MGTGTYTNRWLEHFPINKLEPSQKRLFQRKTLNEHLCYWFKNYRTLLLYFIIDVIVNFFFISSECCTVPFYSRTPN
jgi:hypothetical protein